MEDHSAARPTPAAAPLGLPDAPVAGWDAAVVADRAEPVPAYPPLSVEDLLEVQYGASPRGCRSSHPNPYNLSGSCREDLADLIDQVEHVLVARATRFREYRAGRTPEGRDLVTSGRHVVACRDAPSFADVPARPARRRRRA